MGGRGRRVVASAYRLMVNAGGCAASLREQPGVAVIVGERHLAAGAIELRGEGAVGASEVAVVGEENRIETDARKRRPLVLPERGCRSGGVVEGDAQRVVARLDEDLPGVPVDADGRLARAVGPSGGRAGRRLNAARRLLRSGAILRRGIVHKR